MRVFFFQSFGVHCFMVTAIVLARLAGRPRRRASDGGLPDAGAMYFPLPPGGLPQPGPRPSARKDDHRHDQPRTAAAPCPPRARPPRPSVRAVRVANRIAGKPYRWGGGHRKFDDSGYDCSGAVSFALHGAGLVPSPLDSRRLHAVGQDPGPEERGSPSTESPVTRTP